MDTQEIKSAIPATKAVLGKITKELIESKQAIVPTKGTNAGKQMYLINAKHWAKTAPEDTDTHICLQEAKIGSNTYLNIVGYSSDARMSLQDKLAVLTKHDAAYSMAIASLLK